MGICSSREDPIADKRSKAIDRAIEEDAKKLKRECKVLLLGSGESGKSTIVRQMKIIHQNGYSEKELESFIGIIHRNVFESIMGIIDASASLSILYQNTQVIEATKRLDKIAPIVKYPIKNINNDNGDNDNNYNNDSNFNTIINETENYQSDIISDISHRDYSNIYLNESIGKDILTVWKNETTKDILDRSNEFYLMDSAPYFLDSILRISSESFIPSVDDILHLRIKTTGILETRFSMGELNIHMFDVGGQRSERRKWIHCFEAVTSIIFCVALSEYDQVLLEDSKENRMIESLHLFDSVVNSRWFLRTSIILFMNKIDIFKSKLKKNPLSKYFHSYKGGANVSEATKFIISMFLKRNRARLQIYPHLTQATDTSNIKLVFAAVKVTILQNTLKDSGIV